MNAGRAMIFEDAKRTLDLAVPPHPGDPLGDLAVPSPPARAEIREGRSIGHAYHAVACYLVDLAARQRRGLARLWPVPGPAFGAATPVRLTLTDLGERPIDALVRLEEAVWAAHGERVDFSAPEPAWRDEAVLAQFYGEPWRLPEAQDMADEIVDPVTGEAFRWPLERVFALDWRARALAARKVYRDLPLTPWARASLRSVAERLLVRDRGDCKALFMLLWAEFAESLYLSDYDLVRHPTWLRYAEARLCQRAVRRASSDAAVDGLIRLLFGTGYQPQGLAHLKPWKTVWDHVGALISERPLARRSWGFHRAFGLARAA